MSVDVCLVPRRAKRRAVVARIPLPAAIQDVFYAMNDDMSSVVHRHLPLAEAYQRPWFWLIDAVPGAAAFLARQLARWPTDHAAQFDVPRFPARGVVVEISRFREGCE